MAGATTMVMASLSFMWGDQEQAVALGPRTTIGAVQGNDICLPVEGIAGHHAVVALENGRHVLRRASAEAQIVSGDRMVESLALEDGARFWLGAMEFRYAGGAAAAPAAVPQESAADWAVASLAGARNAILRQLGRVIVGQDAVLNQMLVALFARGHCLLVGVPGLAKTLMVKSLAGALALPFRRIQFTPDLMPSDIVGTDVLQEDRQTGRREFRFHKGPIFASVLLADEINRTPPKTQAALLEAMQEHRVTAGGTTYDLPEPFMVLATQNPIEQEGTYPLPEAQLDRFMFCVQIEYPPIEDEHRVLLETTRDSDARIDPVLNAEAILQLQRVVRQIPVSEHVALYAARLIGATRPGNAGAPEHIVRWVRWGAGTRAGQYLLLAAKAHVLLSGRTSVSCADIREHALPVLRHRIFTNFAAASEGVSTDDIVRRLLAEVPEPRY